MSELKSSIILDLQGNLERQADRFSGSLGRLSSKGSRHMQALNRTFGAVGRGLDKLGNRYSALITGVAGLGTVKMVADLSQRMTQLGVDAGISADGVDKLRQKIMDISRAPDIRINPDELLASVEEVIRSTGDLSFAERNLRNFGLVIRATGSTGKDIGAMATELQKLDKEASPENIIKAFDVFNEQGKAGAVAMRDLASIGPRVFSAYAAKRKGADPATFVRELGAALQTIKGGSGDVRQAATSFEALMRVFGNKDRLKGFTKAGIQIFDPEKLKQNVVDIRPINELMAEIYEVTKGSPTALSQLIPDAEARRAITVGNLTSNLKAYYKVESDGTATQKDSKRNAKELNAILTSLNTAWKDFSAQNITSPIKKIAEDLDSLSPDSIDRWLKAGVAVTGVVGSMVIARKLYQGGRAVMGLFGGKKGVGGKLATAAGFGDAIPVYVVNGPSSIWPGAGGTATGATVANASKLATGAAVAAPLIPLAIAGVTAAASEATGKALANWEVKNTTSDRLRRLQSRHMVMGGGSDSYQAKLIAAELAKRGEMSGKLKISIDMPDAPWAKTKVKEMQSSNLDLDVDSGQMFKAN